MADRCPPDILRILMKLAKEEDLHIFGKVCARWRSVYLAQFPKEVRRFHRVLAARPIYESHFSAKLLSPAQLCLQMMLLVRYYLTKKSLYYSDKLCNPLISDELLIRLINDPRHTLVTLINKNFNHQMVFAALLEMNDVDALRLFAFNFGNHQQINRYPGIVTKNQAIAICVELSGEFIPVWATRYPETVAILARRWRPGQFSAELFYPVADDYVIELAKFSWLPDLANKALTKPQQRYLFRKFYPDKTELINVFPECSKLPGYPTSRSNSRANGIGQDSSSDRHSQQTE